jgi:dUTPase
MLANSVGIIDASYTGNILIALTKIDSNMPDLALPFKCCQLIFRQQVFVDFIDHEDREDHVDIHSTTRNDGGFGSSDK